MTNKTYTNIKCWIPDCTGKVSYQLWGRNGKGEVIFKIICEKCGKEIERTPKELTHIVEANKIVEG